MQPFRVLFRLLVEEIAILLGWNNLLMKSNFSKRNQQGVSRRPQSRRFPKRQNRIIATKNSTVCSGNTENVYKRQTRGVVRIPRLRMSPNAVVVDLTYPDTVYNRNNVGFSYLSWRYRLGSVYDPDPLVGTGGIPGYTNWATMFNQYKVLKTSFSVDICNLEKTPVDSFVCPTVNDMGANIPSSNEMLGNPYCSQSSISATGGMDRTRLTGSIDLGSFFGNTTQYLGDRDYGASVGSNPNQQMVLNIGATSAALFVVNAGLDVRVTITYTVAFYGYNYESA